MNNSATCELHLGQWYTIVTVLIPSCLFPLYYWEATDLQCKNVCRVLTLWLPKFQVSEYEGRSYIAIRPQLFVAMVLDIP